MKLGEKALEAAVKAYISELGKCDGSAPRGTSDYVRTAITAYLKATGWRDIESAPDMGPFLAYEDGAQYKSSRFDGETFTCDSGQPCVYTPDPTHWMPLPEEPNV